MLVREKARYRATLVSHTHWDRAWYCTFQEYRIRLVRLIDRLLDILEKDPEFTVYMLDGQMSVLEDYLEARPTQAEALQQFCRSGRIQVGPWFVLADEFLVSPESLIRNLRLGRRLGIPYGGVVNIGYVPDGFGHIAQLPQILRGFGIDNAFFWRGMGAEGDRLGTEFTWRAPNGDHVTAILMPWGYHNVSNLGFAIHWGDTSQMEFDHALAQAQIDRAIDRLRPMANTDALLLMNGIDHAEAEPRIPQVIRAANERLETVRITQGTLLDHLANVRAGGEMLPEFEGEFRWGRYSEILQGVYSTRIHLKQHNHQAETRMERYVEPLTALAWLSGADVPEGTPDLVDLAWRWVLLNHPHDDMYGCGIDEVHHEMAYRFSQTRQIGEALIRDSMRQIARQIDMTAQTGMPVVVYNPSGWARRELVEAVVDFEFDDPTADFFQVVNTAGEVVPHQIISDEQLFWMEVLKPNRKRRITMLLPVTAPPCGYTTLYIQPRTAQAAPAFMEMLTIHERGMENSFLAVAIEADGSLTVTDKASGRQYFHLNQFYDTEDIGDAYSHCPFPVSEPFTTAGAIDASVSTVERGPLRVTFAIDCSFSIPIGLSSDRSRRSETRVMMPVTVEVSLAAGQPYVSIKTRVRNEAEDHKLTARFPTGVQAKSAFVDESFMVAERDLSLPDSHGWVEDPTPLMHQRAFTDLSSGEYGLAVMNRGLPSVEVSEDGVISLTLIRAVGWLSRDDLWIRRIAAGPLVPTPGAQCKGDYVFEYAVLPHKGDWRDVFQTAYSYNAPLLGVRGDTHPGLELREMNITGDDPSQVKPIPWSRGGRLPDTHSFLAVEPAALVLSAVYRSGDSLVVRLYNITREPLRNARLSFGMPLMFAAKVTMAEEVLEEVPLHDGSHLIFDVQPAEVVTFKVKPAS